MGCVCCVRIGRCCYVLWWVGVLGLCGWRDDIGVIGCFSVVAMW